MEAMKLEDEHFSQIDQHLKISEYRSKTDQHIRWLFESLKQQHKESDKRFERIQNDMDKRFELMQHNMDKRFEQVDKRFEQMQHNMDKRFEQMQHNMDRRFEQVDKRFEQMQYNMDTRFDQVDKRFNQLITFFRWQTGVFITFFIMILGKLIVG